jgi:pimeloyl-ACP methyl ester carboxylesterase
MPILKTRGGASIAWDAFGDPTRPPLLLIQGFSAQMVGWRTGFCQRLADQGFHVIRFDNRDVGLSQRYPEGGYSLADLADDSAALLDGLGLASAHIVGQSMGGMVAQLLAERHPARVRSLGLVYTAANGRHYLAAEAVVELHGMPAPKTRDEYAPYYVRNEAFCASPAYPQDHAWLSELGGVIWDRGWDQAGIDRQLQALLTASDRSDAAREIRMPTAIIAGDGDQLIDCAASRELHQLIPGSTLQIFPGMGHELPQPLWDDIAQRLTANAHNADARA